jgi:predicted nucleotidyltransferase
MNVDMLKSSNSIIFEVVAGSQAYGTQTPTSDIDIRGIFRLSKDAYMSLVPPIQEVSNDSQDIKYYELRKFLDLAKDCNPNIVELFWTPEDCIRIKTPVMDKLLANRSLFISKRAYHTFSGYAFAQIQKAKGKNKFVNNPKPKERPKHEDFCFVIPINDRRLGPNGFALDFTYFDSKLETQMQTTPMRPIPIKSLSFDLSKYHCARLEQTEHIYRLYYYGEESKGVFRGDEMLTPESIPLEHERERFVGFLIYNQDLYEKEKRDWKAYWDWMEHRNEARWVDQEKGKLNYDQKNMMHCCRLLLSGKNILTNGEPIVRFTGDELLFLKGVRKGEFTYEFLMEMIENEMKELETLAEKSTLPWGVNIKQIDDLYKALVDME